MLNINIFKLKYMKVRKNMIFYFLSHFKKKTSKSDYFFEKL